MYGTSRRESLSSLIGTSFRDDSMRPLLSYRAARAHIRENFTETPKARKTAAESNSANNENVGFRRSRDAGRAGRREIINEYQPRAIQADNAPNE